MAESEPRGVSWTAIFGEAFDPPMPINVAPAVVELPGEGTEGRASWRFDVRGRDVTGAALSILVTREGEWPAVLADAAVGARYLGVAIVERVTVQRS